MRVPASVPEERWNPVSLANAARRLAARTQTLVGACEVCTVTYRSRVHYANTLSLKPFQLLARVLQGGADDKNAQELE